MRLGIDNLGVRRGDARRAGLHHWRPPQLLRNGDMWAVHEKCVAGLNDPRDVVVFKVKAHTDASAVDAGVITSEDRDGNARIDSEMPNRAHVA